MNQTSFHPFIFGAVCAVLLLAACSALPAALPATLLPSATSTRTPLPPAISPVFPTGTFFHQHAPQNYCIYQFFDDGTFSYYWMAISADTSGREPFIRGTYTIKDNLYTETVNSGPDCKWPGTYTWTFDGKSLAFQLVGEEKCIDRQRTLESNLLWEIIK
jgi:hypothetical protein